MTVSKAFILSFMLLRSHLGPQITINTLEFLFKSPSILTTLWVFITGVHYLTKIIKKDTIPLRNPDE